MRLIISSSTLTAHIFILHITLQKKPKLKKELVVDSEQNIFYMSAAKSSNKRYKQYHTYYINKLIKQTRKYFLIQNCDERKQNMTLFIAESIAVHCICSQRSIFSV
jgi:hypothetical protein